jgi:hypothetical protein
MRRRKGKRCPCPHRRKRAVRRRRVKCAGGRCKVRRSSRRKYTVATAPRWLRMKWLKKAHAARKYKARCRKKLGLGTGRIPKMVAKPYASPTLGKSDLWEGGDAPPLARSISMTPSHRSGYEDLISASNPYGSFGSWRGGGEGAAAKVRPGDRVTIVDHDGQQRTGRAVMNSSGGGWVLNMGGRYGTPAIANNENIVKVKAGRTRRSNPELLVVSNPGKGGSTMRRRRRRNYWRGNRKGHAAAARKGWRKRRHGRRKGSRRGHRRARRSSRRRGRKGGFRTYRQAVRALGVKAGARAWRKSGKKGKSRRRRSRRSRR